MPFLPRERSTSVLWRVYEVGYSGLGTEWVSVVQLGSNQRKGDGSVRFNEFFTPMKRCLSDGATVPEFFRELISMITDVPEDDWATSKDPSTRMAKDETLRTYSKREKLSKPLARAIVYHLSPETFVDSVNSRPPETLKLLAFEFSSYDPSIDATNVAQKLADCFVEIIRVSADIVPQAQLAQQKQLQALRDLKDRYGEYLREEANNVCAFPGCGRLLIKTGDSGQTMPVYEVSLIDKSAEPEVGNLLAMCPMCQATYSMDANKRICRELKSVKKILVGHMQSMRLLENMPLERGIVGVITKVKNLKEKDLADPSLEPKEIRSKISPDENLALYLAVKGYVDTHYVALKKIFIAADKRRDIDYEEVQDQMKAMYRRLKKAKKSKGEIFQEISEKLHSVSLQEDIYCQIVVAYFIAKCEVFDAAAE